MENHDKHISDESVTTDSNSVRQPASVLKLVLNIFIAVAIVFVGYFGYTFVARSANDSTQSPSPPKPPRVIQLDVLNGCGARGAASKFTNYLRSQGFDVVEMKNYKVSTIAKTLVVDRVGDLAVAHRVAASLGVSDKNVIQQLNPDYFVDVSVIIGADHSTLEPSHH